MSEKKKAALTDAAKNETKPIQSAKPDRLSLNQFCMRLSETDQRVALMGAFEFSERAAGRMYDTEVAYRARYAEFIKKPA